jgi:integrase
MRAEKRHSYTDKSMRTREANFRNYVIPIWGDCNVKRLTARDIDEGISKMHSRFTGRALAGCSVNRVLSVLTDFYSYLVSEGVVQGNPVREVERCNPSPEKPRDALPTDEMDSLFPGVIWEVKDNILLPDTHDKLMKIWRTQKYVCAFLVLKDTGLRPGELVALKWEDWDPEVRFFPIVKAIESGTRDKEKGTKNGTTRPAIVTERAAAEIEILRKKLKPKAEDYMFCNKHGVPFSTQRLNWNFHKSVERAGIQRPEITPYNLRHTFNTIMLEMLSDKTVDHLTGHNTAAMRLHYRHANRESLRREAVFIGEEVNRARLY